MSLSGILKQEYLLRPLNIIRRLRLCSVIGQQFATVRLKSGVTLKVRPDDVIGRSICAFHVYDLAESEVAWRLVQAGDRVLDVGANIGYGAVLMAIKVGPTGRVDAFEPMPDVFQELAANVESLLKLGPLFQINIHQVAVSDQAATCALELPQGSNRGMARLVKGSAEATSAPTISVETVRLDELFTAGIRIKLIKIDVEGHELSVLMGARKLLSSGSVINVIFEEFEKYPTSTHTYMESLGFQIFRIAKGFQKPKLLPPAAQVNSSWEPPNYLATKDASAALSVCYSTGWQVF